MLIRPFRTVCSGCCEPGDVRHVNQDHILALQGEIGRYTAGMFLVADGCGGMSRGELVSRFLQESFRVIWEQELPKLLSAGRREKDSVLRALSSWVDQINGVAYAFRQRTGEQIGSTLTVLMTLDGEYYILNVGDSRAYLFRRGRLSQLTQDQTLVADMLRNHELTPEAAARFPHKNALTMCVGYFEQIHAFQLHGKLRKGDIFLLCSDGLYKELDEKELIQAMPDWVTAESARKLRDRIPPGTAADNVSALLVQIIP